jgi:hypothetical protein
MSQAPPPPPPLPESDSKDNSTTTIVVIVAVVGGVVLLVCGGLLVGILLPAVGKRARDRQPGRFIGKDDRYLHVDVCLFGGEQ